MLTNLPSHQGLCFLYNAELLCDTPWEIHHPYASDPRTKPITTPSSSSSTSTCHTTATRNGPPVPVASLLGTTRPRQPAPVCLPAPPETRRLLTPSAQERAPRYLGRRLPHSGTSSRVCSPRYRVLQGCWLSSIITRPSRPQRSTSGHPMGTAYGDGRSDLHAGSCFCGYSADRFIEVERAIENLVKSGKMFGAPGGRREFLPPFPPGPARFFPNPGKYA